MPRRAEDGHCPNWDALYEAAAAQEGYFSLQQARAAGYSSQLLQYQLRVGKVRRALRGVYRLVHFPASEREDLVPVWLWSGGEGVFGLETALSIHGISDALPSCHELFLPVAWSNRRVKSPRGVRLLYADVPHSDWEWIGPVPVTTPGRTLRDCIRHHVQPDLIEQAFEDAVKQGLLTRRDARAIKREAA